ncbi:hypothetical protein ACLK1T_07815 [Escherichia coli]
MKKPLAARCFTQISDADRIFAELLTGLAAAQPGFPLAQLKTFVLGICPNKTCPAWH